MLSRVHQIKRWLAATDSDLALLLGLTLAGLIIRWFLVLGYVLGDDGPYTEWMNNILHGNYPYIEPIGQYVYRPAWLFPLAASVRLLGWSTQGVVFYPLLTGSLLPLLTALWLRRHLPAGSKAPLLCAVIMACHPTLFVDSLVLVNEMPMIFWCLLCVNLFGVAYARMATAARPAGNLPALAGLSLLAGLAFAAAYQVKASAMPILGLWLGGEFILLVCERGWPKTTHLSIAALAFFVPAGLVQYFYFIKIGHPLGNFIGEVKLYDTWLPPEYFEGKLATGDLHLLYYRALFMPAGEVGFRVLLHGIWTWLGAGLAVLLAIFWRKLPVRERALAGILVLTSVALFLFMEFWPARLEPYYLPNCYTGRPWRYIDVLGPPCVAWVAIMLTLPGVFQRPLLAALRLLLLGLGFGVAGYSLIVRYHELADRSAEFRDLANNGAPIIEPYLGLSQIIDLHGWGQLRTALHWADRPVLRPTTANLLDLRKSPAVCIWTGGARHEGVFGDAALAPDKIQVVGGDLTLVHTWPGLRRPWKTWPLQLWLFTPNKAGAP